MKPDRAAALAAEAYEQWQADRLDEAAANYAEALRLAPADALALADYHGEYAAVLESLGQLAQAEQQLEAALALEIARAADPDEVGVVIARYFLAEFLLRNAEARRALEGVRPHLASATHGLWLLHLIAAEAEVVLGDIEAAGQSARHALRTAPSDDKRSELRLRFLEMGLHDDAY